MFLLERPMPKTSKPQPMSAATRKQQAHMRRDQMQTRLIMGAAGGLIVLIILLLVLGALQTYVFHLNDPLGTVYGETITIGQFQKEFRYELWSMMDSFQEAIDNANARGDSTTAKQTYTQASQYWTTFYESPVTQQQAVLFLENAIIARREAAQRGFTVSDAEVEERIHSMFGYIPETTLTTMAQSTATPVLTFAATEVPGGPTAMPSLTPTASAAPTSTPNTASTTPTAAPTIQTGDMFQTSYAKFLVRLKSKTGMDETEYRNRIRTELLIEKMRTTIVASVPRIQNQVHAQQIVCADEGTANRAAARLASGEDWVTVTRETSVDERTKNLAGDLGWVLISNLDPAIAEKLSPLAVGGVSAPLLNASDNRWYIYRVIEIGPRALSDEGYADAQNKFFQEWQNQSQNDKTIVNMNPLTPDIIPSDAKPNP
jgi:parvulin-like peptidyl-prolyl isomerase